MMQRRRFEALIGLYLDQLPRELAARLDNLVIQVRESADVEILTETGGSGEDDLLGYYRGVPLPERYGGELPSEIYIFRRTILLHARETGQSLRKVLRETLLHELAHHFGFSEADLEPLEKQWAGLV